MFGAAVNAGQVLLPVVGVLMSVVSAYYYLGLVVAMYMREPASEDAWAPVGAASGLGLALCAAVVLLLGVYPAPVLSVARIAASALR
jgi:NADH-quinone oxidoreductase subunit N